MRRNAAGQNLQVMMRTSSAAIQAIVPLVVRTSCTSTNTNASPIVVTTASSQSHGMIVGNRVVIASSSQTAINGTWTVFSVPSLTSFQICDPETGAVQNGNGGATGTGASVTPWSVNVRVSKDGAAHVNGAGTLTHIGKTAINTADTADANQIRAVTAVTLSQTAVGGTAMVVSSTVAGIGGSTLGLWSYTPTASETNASQVSFTFTSTALGAISVTQTFEPTAGPIVLQTTIATYSSQTSFTLTAGHTADDTYNGYLCVVYDSTTEAQTAIGVVLDYTGSTKTITLLGSPLTASFTFAAGDFITLIAEVSLKPATLNRNLVVDSNGLADATAVKLGPSGTATGQTARDVGASVLLSSGTGTGQVNLTGGKVDLAATGLDSIPVADPSGVATTFPTMMVQLWRRFFKKATKTSTQIKTYANDGTTVVTTQAVDDTAGTQTQNAAS